MAKTFTNRQLVGGNQIKNDYQKINLNADELNQDLIDLYAQDETLYNRIDNIIAQSGTSDTEVVDARQSTTLGVTYPILKDRFEAIESDLQVLDTEVVDARQSTSLGVTYPVLKDRFEAIESDLQVPETTPFTTSSSIESLPVGTVDGKVSNFKKEGLTLVNSVENGDFSNGTNGWVGVNSSLTELNNILKVTCDGTSSSARVYQAVNHKLGEKYFVYAKARVTNSDATRLELQYFDDGTVGVSLILNPVINTWYELYGTFTSADDITRLPQLYQLYADATTANGKVMEIDGNVGVHAINLTALQLEDLTEPQILDLVRSGYIDGIQGVVRPKIEIVGKNLIQDHIVGYVDVLNNKYNTSVTTAVSGVGKCKEGDVLVAQTNGNRNILGFFENYPSSNEPLLASVSTNPYTITAPSKAKYFAWYDNNDNGNVPTASQVEYGSTPTEYEPYKSSQLSSDVTLHRLPNGIKDRVYEDDGEVWKEKKVSDLTSIATATVISTTNYPLAKAGGSFVLKQDDGTFVVGVIDGTYTTTDAGDFIYELETSELINLTEQGLVSGELFSYENGTVYNTSDTFHAQNVSFDVPTNRGAQIESLLDSANYQAKKQASQDEINAEFDLRLSLLEGV